MNIQELKHKMNNVPDHKMNHSTPMNKPMSKSNALNKAKSYTGHYQEGSDGKIRQQSQKQVDMKYHDISKGTAPKHKALQNAKKLKTSGSKFFSEMNKGEKTKHVNAGTGRRLTSEQSAFKTRNDRPVVGAAKVPSNSHEHNEYQMKHKRAYND
jgi:hypothetical protein